MFKHNYKKGAPVIVTCPGCHKSRQVGYNRKWHNNLTQPCASCTQKPEKAWLKEILAKPEPDLKVWEEPAIVFEVPETIQAITNENLINAIQAEQWIKDEILRRLKTTDEALEVMEIVGGIYPDAPLMVRTPVHAMLKAAGRLI